MAAKIQDGDLTLIKNLSKAVAPIEGGGRGLSPPRLSIFLLVSLIQCLIYVHAYQDLVHFST